MRKKGFSLWILGHVYASWLCYGRNWILSGKECHEFDGKKFKVYP